MAWGRRCELGCESWPDESDFDFCPSCGEPTVRYSNLTPLDADEAHSLRRHAAFERYYEGYCNRRGITVDGPLPDDADTLVQKATSRSA